MTRSALLNFLCLFGLMLTACTPKATEALLEPGNALGMVLAEKSAQISEPKKQIVIIAPDASWGPASSVEEAFRAALKKQGVTVLATKAVSLGDPMKSGIVGLKAADMLEVIQKYPDAGAIVSLVGAPLLSSANPAGLPGIHPPILVVATANLGTLPGVPGNQNALLDLVEAGLIQLAIVDGSGNATSDAAKADAAHEMFNQHFQTLFAPKSDESKARAVIRQ